tara:strand:- start:55540 stop:56895 length:1356 start_codon:yes stop_codon:yes gene_type:complete
MAAIALAVAASVAITCGSHQGACCAQDLSPFDSRNQPTLADDINTLFPPPPTQSPGARRAVRPAQITATTRWAFRALDSVTVHSPIVRLGDVVRPLDPDMAAWQRLSRSPIALVPVGGEVMTIDRVRLSEAITSAEATARAIDWIGAQRIKVHYRAQTDSERQAELAQAFNAQANPTPSESIPTYGFNARGSLPPAAGRARIASQGAPSNVRQTSHFGAADRILLDPDLPPFDPVLVKRLIYWIQLAVDRMYPQIGDAYALHIDDKQAVLRQLQIATGIDHVEFQNSSVDEGHHRLHVTGRSTGGPIQAEIDISLAAHPVAIVPKDSFRRGHRLQSDELATRPIPEKEWDDRYITDRNELIGMEAKTTLRENVPITRDSIGMPILIRRGDRVEVRVMGGGISVTTNGKALEEGSESDLIEIETLEPRKRLVARVAGPGIVEIVTRPPRVES